MVRLAPVEDRLLDVGCQEREPHNVLIVGRGWCSFHSRKPAFSSQHRVCLAQCSNQDAIGLRRTDQCRDYEATATACREDGGQQDGDAVWDRSGEMRPAMHGLVKIRER